MSWARLSRLRRAAQSIQHSLTSRRLLRRPVTLHITPTLSDPEHWLNYRSMSTWSLTVHSDTVRIKLTLRNLLYINSNNNDYTLYIWSKSQSAVCICVCSQTNQLKNEKCNKTKDGGGYSYRKWETADLKGKGKPQKEKPDRERMRRGYVVRCIRA